MGELAWVGTWEKRLQQSRQSGCIMTRTGIYMFHAWPAKVKVHVHTLTEIKHDVCQLSMLLHFNGSGRFTRDCTISKRSCFDCRGQATHRHTPRDKHH